MIHMTPEQYAELTGQPVKRNKYRNRRVQLDGIWFDSQKEADRWCILIYCAKAGEIADLRRQVRYKLAGGIVYIADFVYTENGREVIEDVKGYKTQVYRMKKKLMKEAGYEIREV